MSTKRNENKEELFTEGAVTFFRGDSGNFYFHVKADNGEIIAQSESYVSLAGAKKGAASLKRNMADE